MAALGIVLIWGGYTMGIFGYAKIKNAKQVSWPLSLSQIALPSHRSEYMVIAQTWTEATPGAATGATATTPTTPTPTKGPNPGQTGPVGGGTSARGSDQTP